MSRKARARGGERPPRAGAARAPRAPRADSPPPAPAPPLPLVHPALLAAALAAAASIVLVVTYRIYDTDFWQHLRVGREVWESLRVPVRQVWSWPTYGAPDVNSSWGFEALMWPFWQAGGVVGLFAWRWLATLAAFGLAWAAARRMGARGLTPLVALAACAVVYRQRSQIRPETLVAILMALEILILEIRRRGGRDLSVAIVGIAWVWANVHISYHFGLALLGLYALEAHAVRAGWLAPAAGGGADGARPGAGRLVAVGAAALAISFVNPFGWRALWQPFDYFFFLRHEPVFRIISELQPIDWQLNRRNPLALLLVAWPLLLAWRWRRRGFDLVETALCAGFTALAFLSQRFVGFYALVAAPFLARDLDAWVAARRWPGWTAPPAARAALAAAAAAALALPEWSIGDPPNGVGILAKSYPIAACDWIERHGVRGRAFNQFRSGGYLIWRFWPQRDRLPFMDVHQPGTPEIRRMYVDALLREEGWRALDRRFAFEWVLLSRPPVPGDGLLDFLDADPRWAPVFVDDAAALYVARGGRHAALAARFAYRELGGGEARLTRLADSSAADSALRLRVRRELERQAAASAFDALSHSFLANLDLIEQRFDSARVRLDRALAIDPEVPDAHLRLATIALAAGRPFAALEELERERALRRRRSRDLRGLEARFGLVHEQLGDPPRAAAAYRRELRRDPANPLARERLQALEGAP